MILACSSERLAILSGSRLVVLTRNMGKIVGVYSYTRQADGWLNNYTGKVTAQLAEAALEELALAALAKAPATAEGGAA